MRSSDPTVCRIALLLAWVFLAVASAGAAPGPFTDDAQAGGPGSVTLDAQARAALWAQSLPMRQDGAGALQGARLQGQKAPASLKAIVLLCDFSDSLLLGRYGVVPGDFPLPRQSEIYFDAHDPLYFQHLLGDVALYFASVSGGDFSFEFDVHPQAVNLPHPMSHYGNHPEHGEQPFALAAEVVAAVDEQVDFSAYDTVMLVHAGAGEETDILGDSPEQIFSTYLDPGDFADAQAEGLLPEAYLPGQPEEARITHVLVLPETEYQDPIGGYGGYFGSLGVYCFEVGLRLGMLSLSDFTPAGNPDSQGVGEFCLMGYGLFVGMGWIPPHPCAFNKALMGWLEPAAVDPFAGGRIALTPAEDPGGATAAARVEISGQEYWLLEYRLQDPNGDGIFSFAGDRNGNNVPDFYDYDSPTGDGVPPWGETFDVATDTLESLSGAEWDFFMSENAARAPGVKGAGSGVYVWHVDEGRIREVFTSADNLFNADPGHKSVDLEEADGIQDLDTNIPSEFMLGGDQDCFRGEGAALFGPDTLPATDTALGAVTGIVLDGFSDVVDDSTGYVLLQEGDLTLWGIDYADTMYVNVRTGPAEASAPVLGARLVLPPDVDLRGSHVLVGDLQGGDTAQEIILSGRQGEVYALGGDLTEVVDRDGDPATVLPLATGLWDGKPVPWNPPAAMGDLDADGQPEIVLTGPHGLYAFNPDGTEVRPALPDRAGLFAELPACSLPPVLVPLLEDSVAGDPTAAVHAVVVAESQGRCWLRRYGADGGFAEADLGPGQAVAAPVRLQGDAFVLAVIDTAGQDSQRLVVCSLPASGWEPSVLPVPLPMAPAGVPVSCGYLDEAEAADRRRFVLVAGREPGGATVVLDAELRPVGAPLPWSTRIAVASPLGPGGTFVGPSLLGRIGSGGDWSDGWPYRGELGAAPPLGGPLAGAVAGVDLPLPQHIFAAPDGRIFALGPRGEGIPGWPLAGPAAVAGTPALGDLGGGPDLDLAAVGTFERIEGLAPPTGELTGSPVSTVMVWLDAVQAPAAWPMWGGCAWRDGTGYAQAAGQGQAAAAGAGLVTGSHGCYPNPLGDGPLFVRGQLRAAGQARAAVYDLQGELVREGQWRAVPGTDPFTLEISLDGVASGMYLCRLEVRSAGIVDRSVIAFAVVR